MMAFGSRFKKIRMAGVLVLQNENKTADYGQKQNHHRSLHHFYP